MDRGSAYNKFLHGKTPPSRIAIDEDTGWKLVDIITDLINEGIFKIPANPAKKTNSLD